MEEDKTERIAVRTDNKVLDEIISDDKYIIKIKESIKIVKIRESYDEYGEEIIEEEVLEEMNSIMTREFFIKGFEPIYNEMGEPVGFAKELREVGYVFGNTVSGIVAKAVILRPHTRLMNSKVGIVYTTHDNILKSNVINMVVMK